MNESTLENTSSQEEVSSEKETTPKLFAGSGRIGRLHFLLFFNLINLLPALAILLTISTGLILHRDGITILMTFITFLIGGVALVMNFIIPIRRLNDLDATGWWVLAAFFPIANIILMLVLLFAPGTKGDNSYGQQPPAPSDNVKVGIVLITIIFTSIMIIGFSSLQSTPSYYP
ncbi:MULTISPECIES: DUF805 domain-containing protein [unclassified Halomonas]|uniref:DUF805 domain-containing protein n=1 Tax=unclassified Halomonas TaxID=2609666 RepID=UPI0006DA0463|nr:MULTISPECIES: DUF805 domain-containing protein [unclassified Halomonas]KPQ22651.1 MAG: putative membrane protein [Halomonas sp. HL-93]SBR45437.1 Uncharacterized membrane protein YhaH, DUF805 family [Halomonas sp. HL-93]SNY98297.1 Uncharacterized membrane protein YhaH, DUF805 family [Halomonas sp. hl-4]